MKRKTQHRMIYILSCILICILALDALLYWIDPLGLVQAVHAKSDLHAVMVEHPTGYAIETGEHTFNYYTVTTLADTSRLVPDTNTQAACTIAAIGDSVTWGQGVNDNETWVNVIAQSFQDVHFVNAARSDYSAVNVARLKDTYAADGYIWLLITNDAIEPYVFYEFRSTMPYPPATRLYFDWIFRRPEVTENREPDMEVYWQAVEQIIAEDTLVFGIEGDPLARMTTVHSPIHLIPQWTDNVSAVDAHASARGNLEIADSVLPFLEPFISRVCS